MTKTNGEGADALARLAEEVEQERQEKGHTPFDDTGVESEENATTREDHEGAGLKPKDPNNPDRAGVAGAVGLAGRAQRPGAV